MGLLAAGGMVSAALPGDPRADERDLRVLVDKEEILDLRCTSRSVVFVSMLAA